MYNLCSYKLGNLSWGKKTASPEGSTCSQSEIAWCAILSGCFSRGIFRGGKLLFFCLIEITVTSWSWGNKKKSPQKKFSGDNLTIKSQNFFLFKFILNILGCFLRNWNFYRNNFPQPQNLRINPMLKKKASNLSVIFLSRAIFKHWRKKWDSSSQYMLFVYGKP